jgi:hypothetical protein
MAMMQRSGANWTLDTSSLDIFGSTLQSWVCGMLMYVVTVMLSAVLFFETALKRGILIQVQESQQSVDNVWYLSPEF